MKSCSTSFVIKELQIKATMRNTMYLLKWLKLGHTQLTSIDDKCRAQKLFITGGNENTKVAVFCKTKHSLIIQSSLGIYSTDLKTSHKTCT